MRRQRITSLEVPRRPGVPPGPYLVLGLGRAGLAAAEALSDIAGPDRVRACDTGAPEWARPRMARLSSRGVAVEPHSDGTSAFASDRPPACVVKSPGIPFSAPALQRAEEMGVPVLDELELGWRLGRAPVIAVTGTNGKSTVCSLLVAIAGASGLDAAVAGNSHFGPPLSAVAPAGADGVVCEVSSFQLEGCPELVPEAAVLTNLHPEHLNRHGTMEAYAACKRRLFVRGQTSTPLAVMNVDDEHGAQLAAEVAAAGGGVVRYGCGPTAEFRLRRCGWTLTSGWLEVDTPEGAVTLRTRLPGRHNAVNVLAAFAAARALGFDLDSIVVTIERTPVLPGRFEVVDEEQPFDVVVDFAHTPDAVEAVIDAARQLVRRRPGARVHALVSVAGHRYRELSRPIGAAAATLADRVILTQGSSRGAVSAEVMAPLIDGARSVPGASVEVVTSRRAAIRHALASASRHDVVLVLGRGALPRLTMSANGDGSPFDDRVVVREELRALLPGRDLPSAHAGRATMRA